MKKIVLLSTCLVVLPALPYPGDSQEDDLHTAYGEINGRMYTSMTRLQRITFLNGLRTGILYGIRISTEPNTTERSSLLPHGGTDLQLGEVDEQLMDYYRDSANRKIGVSAMWLVAVKRMRGEPDLEQTIERLRRQHTREALP